MTDEQKLTFLLNELKLLARKRHCYDGRGGDNLYYYTDDHDATFDDGSQYGLVSFARSILESMSESYETCDSKWDDPIPPGVDPWNLRGRS